MPRFTTTKEIIEHLIKAGLTQKQAEVWTEIFIEIRNQKLQAEEKNFSERNFWKGKPAT